MNSPLPPEAPPPRLCEIVKAYPEQEYGFNLHAERGKGQFIGEVDPESPADIAGLKAGDRIVAVNAHLIDADSHKQVVSRIKENPLACTLLVIEEEGEVWYRERRIPITLTQSNIHYCTPAKAQYHASATPPPDYGSDVAKASPSPPPPSPPPSKPRARLCVLAKQTPADEYGFNLHADRNKGHFIGGVDARSLAEAAGLEEGQRIVGVNGVLIYPTSPHKEVVALIKQESFRTQLLVASPEVDAWYRNHGAEFQFQGAEVCRRDGGRLATTPLADANGHGSNGHGNGHSPAPVAHHSPVPNGHTAHNGTHQPSPPPSIGRHSHQESAEGLARATAAVAIEEHSQPGPPSPGLGDGNRLHKTTALSENSLPPDNRSSASSQHSQASPVGRPLRNGSPGSSSGQSGLSSNLSSPQPPLASPAPRPVPPPPGPVDPELDAVFGMSAAQMRAKLAAKKRISGAPIKGSGLSIQEKYDIVRNL